ncbi:hypothetical protein HYH03_000632 [Edaphochlamys debaryana]|uniref:glutamate formimidoyltransferase n=1 Tax=Edaphochlamys debaryana TaxID=47281 RepID=A0A835YPE2_9CHLO|nr:hypothetical protein HYH03_000632 [Edaphochlamys debaryana]|eukprot:KAG2502145.1 hypothetical protein HYH03_000632 [Edaphochlamys debaryana]
MLANLFVDEPYNRTGFTLVSSQPDALTEATLRLSRAALRLLDLRSQEGGHPRLGVVDHIALHPLGGLARGPPPTTLSQAQAAAGGGGPPTVWVPPPTASAAAMGVAATCAHLLARELAGGAAAGGAGEGALPGVPVYFYGHAHSGRRGLADVRRALGYFRSAPDGRWHGGLGSAQQPSADLTAFPPDLGPMEAPAASGVVTIGAGPWVTNFNIPLTGVDLAVARRLAKALSERGGGLPGVQAMALLHDGEQLEVACNLLDTAAAPPVVVEQRLAALISGAHLPPSVQLPGYRTNLSPEQLLRRAAQLEAAGRRGGGQARGPPPAAAAAAQPPLGLGLRVEAEGGAGLKQMAAGR